MINPVTYNYNNYYNMDTNIKNRAPEAVSKITGVNPIDEKSKLLVGQTKSSECQTCSNRKYIDQSDEGNVSFQTPTHISPENSFSLVASHEQEHVSNAVSKGNQPGNQLVSASVRLVMDVCPECSKPYIAGGSTTTQIKYDVSNPYENARKTVEGSLLKGLHFDAVA